MQNAIAALIVATTFVVPGRVLGATIDVVPGESIQAAIAAAADGDVIRVEPGTYQENIDFLGKALVVRGSGPATVLRGTGAGSIVRFAGGEGAASVLDSFTITGGLADEGGGIHVSNSSPTIVRNVIIDNRAVRLGSGIYLAASSAAVLNNVIAFNRNAGGDPHGVEVVNSAAHIVNNTIVHGDSNGLILRGASPALVLNNVIAHNGSARAFDRRGRGICDFSGGRAQIHYNLFHRNRIAALLTDGIDFRRSRRAEQTLGPPRLLGNLDGAPGFEGRRPRTPAAASAEGFRLRAKSRARDRGNPDSAYADLDGSRNDVGFTGGPFAPDWLGD